MSDDTDIIPGSGNVFRDLGHPGADREQLRSLLAARVIGVLDEHKMTVRAAPEVTGVAAADFSRIRKGDLGRFNARATNAARRWKQRPNDRPLGISRVACTA